MPRLGCIVVCAVALLATTAAADEPAAPPSFGAKGTTRFILVPILGYTRQGRELMAAFDVEVDYFVVKDVSVNLGVQGFLFDQLGPTAVGAGPAATVRWHFLSRDHGSLFVAGGVGVMGTDPRVPADGSYWNLTPRAAMGFTHDVFDRTRLIGGVRVNHMVGLDNPDSPSHTTIQFFLGLSVPF